ncbi:MAG: sigma-70 family RNA polymerase sigma factor [Spirochaetia bacterium]|nr:sigma-70 family RNA polymerase sigma factor [Spirochaetia bacterium]
MEPSLREDPEIIQDIMAGNQTATEELIRKYQKRVYNTIYGMTLNYDEAWDISQEALVKVVRNIGSFKGQSSFWTYLYRITVNSVYDYKRKQKVRSRVSNFTDMENPGDNRQFEVKDLVNIEEDYEKKELGDRLKSSLSHLTEIQKQVFVLKNIDGLKIREISQVLRISEGTVKSHLNRATVKIRDVLGGMLK